MKLSPKLLIPATLVLTALVSTSTAAQAQSIGASYYRSYGGNVAYGYVSADAGAHLDKSRYVSHRVVQHTYDVGAGAHVRAGVTVLWRSIDAFRCEADAGMHDDTGSTSGTSAAITGLLRIGPWTLASYNRTYDLTATHNFGPYSLFGGGLRALFWVGPVPLTVQGDAGCGARATFQVNLNPFEHFARATPSANGWAYGSMSAGVGVPGFSAGAVSTLQLANATLGYTLSADLEDGVSGQLGYSMVPIAIYLGLYAEVNLWYWHEYWYRQIYSWSAGSVSGTTVLN